MRRKVLFLIESFAGGGAEKVLSTIVNHIDKQKFDITVCVISGGGVYEGDIAKSVRVHSVLKRIDLYKGVGKIWYWIKHHLIYEWLPKKYVYKLFIPKGNDVEVAFVEGYSTLLLASSTNKHAKRIAWVHCDLQSQPWPILQGIYRNKEEEETIYKSYNSVVCVSENVESVMKKYYGLSNTVTIYNPVDVADIRRLASIECDWHVDTLQYNIISVGRLEKVKGFDILIPIVCDARNKGIDVHLWIVGEGSERQNLQSLVKNMGIERSVTFTGFLTNPYSLMSQMDLFVCSSRAEGFSLVILEAMILGLPIVTTNCAGPYELVGDSEYGLLVENIDGIYRGIMSLFDNVNLRKYYHHKSFDRAECFDLKKMIEDIEKVLV